MGNCEAKRQPVLFASRTGFMLWEGCFPDTSESVTDPGRQCPCFSTSLSPAQTSQALPQLEKAWKKPQAHAGMGVRAAPEEAGWLCSSYALELGCVCVMQFSGCAPPRPLPLPSMPSRPVIPSLSNKGSNEGRLEGPRGLDVQE